jgi:hypothetical protein
MLPIPRVESFAALNAQLLEHCRRRLGDRLRGHDETIGERDQASLLPLPATPYEAREKKNARVSSLSLVRYRGNDRYAHTSRDLLTYHFSLHSADTFPSATASPSQSALALIPLATAASRSSATCC